MLKGHLSKRTWDSPEKKQNKKRARGTICESCIWSWQNENGRWLQPGLCAYILHRRQSPSASARHSGDGWQGRQHVPCRGEKVFKHGGGVLRVPFSPWFRGTPTRKSRFGSPKLVFKHYTTIIFRLLRPSCRRSILGPQWPVTCATPSTGSDCPKIGNLTLQWASNSHVCCFSPKHFGKTALT